LRDILSLLQREVNVMTSQRHGIDLSQGDNLSDELLDGLLQTLGVRTDTVAIRCFQHVHGATARAATNIADWMSYLPKECVKAMINDGWHWST
jgi:hypothetical protein